MFGVSWIDWLVLVFYLAVIAVIGVSAAKRVRNAASFFIGDRKFGKVMMMFFTFGTSTHSDQAVSIAAKTYRSGVSGIWRCIWVCHPSGTIVFSQDSNPRIELTPQTHLA